MHKRENSKHWIYIVHNAGVVKAEIIWILKSICSGYSNRSCEQLNCTLKAMFPDSKLAEAFSMGRTKSMYMINHGLAPFFKSLLLSELNKSDIFKFSFDVNLNQVTQTCEMDVYVWFWNVTKLKVNVRFIGSTFFSHGTHQNLLKHFHEVTKELDHLKLYQISMYGPSVNLKFYNEIVQDTQENMVHSLIDIGSCSLHIVHGSFKTDAEKTGWNL